MGIGDWGLGIGDWGLGPIPNPQSPIPNPQQRNNSQIMEDLNLKILTTVKYTKTRRHNQVLY